MSVLSTLAKLVANSGSKNVNKGKNPAIANMNGGTAKHAPKGGVRSGNTTAHSRKKG